MSQKPEKTNRIIEMLGEGATTEEIIEETGCAASTITYAKKKMSTELRKREKAESEAESAAIDADVQTFMKRVRITPEPEEEEQDRKETEYGCACGARWTGYEDETQTVCPECGTEFA